MTNLHLASLQNWAMGGTQGKKRPSISPKDSEQSGYYARGQSFVRQDAFQRALETLRLNCGCIWTLWSPSQPCKPTSWSWLTQRNPHVLWGLIIMMEKYIPLPNPISNKPPEIRWVSYSLFQGSFSALFRLNNHPTRHAATHMTRWIQKRWFHPTFRWFCGLLDPRYK